MNSEDIYDLLVKFTDENVSEIVEWVINHRKVLSTRETNESLTSHRQITTTNLGVNYLNINLSAFKEVLVKHQKYKNGVAQRSHHIDRYVQTIILPQIPLEHYTYTRSLYSENKYEELYDFLEKGVYQVDCVPDTVHDQRQELSQIDSATNVDSYRRRLLSDTQKLIEEILAILTSEYESRTNDIRSSLQKYLEAHNRAYQKARADLRRVENAIQRIKEDSVLSSSERNSLELSLYEARTKIEALLEREGVNIRDVQIFVAEIRKAKARFEEIITILEEKNKQAITRQSYIALLKEVDTNVPVLDSYFSDISTKLKAEISSYKFSLEIMSRQVSSKLLAGFDAQSDLTSILGISFGSPISIQTVLGEESGYDLDIMFLEELKI